MRLKDFTTLRTSAEFDALYKRAPKWHSATFVLFYRPGGERKVGFTVSKKIGNAVVRARTKRRFRALFVAFASTLRDGSYVMVAKPSIVEIPFEMLRKELMVALRKLGATTEA